MLNNLENFEVYIACGYTDLRFGVDGLAATIKETFNLDPCSEGKIFLFCGRKSDRIKCLVWEGDGFLMLYKRLSKGRFQWPRSYDDLRSLSPSQFHRLMTGFAVDPSIEKIAPAKHIL